MPLQTDRLALPLLAAAQAQKEMTHNAALAQLDITTQAAVQAVAPSAIPSSPSVGQCWIVGAGATGAWTSHDHAIAAWTSGGWRFVSPVEGMSVWSIADNVDARYAGGGWTVGTINAARIEVAGLQVVGERHPSIVSPSGGATVDSQARSAIETILSALAAHGLIAT